MAACQPPILLQSIQSDGSVTPDDLLDNLGANAELWAECRSIASGWQDLARRNGWVR